jgi:hypothetical protein
MTARYMIESGKWDKRTNYEMKLERDRRQEEELNFSGAIFLRTNTT